MHGHETSAALLRLPLACHPLRLGEFGGVQSLGDKIPIMGRIIAGLGIFRPRGSQIEPQVRLRIISRDATSLSYPMPRLYCALASPRSAALRYYFTASHSPARAVAGAVHHSEAVLRVGVPLVGGFAEPDQSLRLVLRRAVAVGVHQSEAILRVGAPPSANGRTSAIAVA
jgi:hypothetical protein